MKSVELTFDTRSSWYLDLTGSISGWLAEERAGDGLLNVFAPHATVGLVVMELHAGSEDDLREALDRLLPRDSRYRHRHGSVGHGADHVLPAFLSPSVTVPVLGGRPALGTWQHVVMVDTNVDNPTRHIRLSLLTD
jgi:secondary thiamine-phosphate synthase enzyme